MFVGHPSHLAIDTRFRQTNRDRFVARESLARIANGESSSTRLPFVEALTAFGGRVHLIPSCFRPRVPATSSVAMPPA